MDNQGKLPSRRDLLACSHSSPALSCTFRFQRTSRYSTILLASQAAPSYRGPVQPPTLPSPPEKCRQDVAAQVVSRNSPSSSRLIHCSRGLLANIIILRNETKASSSLRGWHPACWRKSNPRSYGHGKPLPRNPFQLLRQNRHNHLCRYRLSQHPNQPLNPYLSQHLLCPPRQRLKPRRCRVYESAFGTRPTTSSKRASPSWSKRTRRSYRLGFIKTTRTLLPSNQRKTR